MAAGDPLVPHPVSVRFVMSLLCNTPTVSHMITASLNTFNNSNSKKITHKVNFFK